jgi:hypothetical protein
VDFECQLDQFLSNDVGRLSKRFQHQSFAEGNRLARWAEVAEHETESGGHRLFACLAGESGDLRLSELYSGECAIVLIDDEGRKGIGTVGRCRLS